jgi:hypothetical protein
MKKIIFCLLAFPVISWSQLKSPDDFLPHKVGTQFTPHHMLVNYMHHVADNSNMVKLWEYGTTNQDRPLLLLCISTEENLKNLESIRQNNLIKTGLLPGQNNPAMDKAIVWLSFSVHGNEASGSESSMPVLYDLVNPDNLTTKKWLENTIVLFDPSINPDGYDRFTHWFRNVSNKIPDIDPQAKEQREPWPGGRVNHYLFDLNRDWAWQTQHESAFRITQYHKWMPHIHVDFHEMGANSPYYFAPAAKPYHEYITSWQREFQHIVGKNNAKYFDQNGWLYFTKEVFDLLYPSYGDTWPTYNGAIGMTYEQGASRSRALQLQNGDVLTLSDRVKHHHAAALSTIESAHLNATKLVREFELFFKNSSEKPLGSYTTFVIKNSNPNGKLQALTTLLDKNGIQYGKAGFTKSNMTGYHYDNQSNTSFTIDSSDLIISAYQPKSVLTQILFNPDNLIEDSLTYDITSWSLPYVFGIEAFAVKEKFLPTQKMDYTQFKTQKNLSPLAFAYVIRHESFDDIKFLGKIMRKGVKPRVAMEAFTLESVSYPAGTMIVTKADNKHLNENLTWILQEAIENLHVDIAETTTGFSDLGPDLGSRKFKFLRTPKIMLLSGEWTFANSFGQMWHYFESELKYPVHIVDANNFGRTDLKSYNLIIMPDGRYRFNPSEMEKLSQWITEGGRVIASGLANQTFENKPGFALKTLSEEENKKQRDEIEKAERLTPYADRERNAATDNIPGAFFKLNLDNTHPLGFGLKPTFYTLKNSELAYPHLSGAYNVGYLREELKLSGFAGQRILNKLKNTTSFAVEEKGGGAIIYMVDNPLFRAFWENGKILFSNAIFFAGQ